MLVKIDTVLQLFFIDVQNLRQNARCNLYILSPSRASYSLMFIIVPYLNFYHICDIWFHVLNLSIIIKILNLSIILLVFIYHITNLSTFVPIFLAEFRHKLIIHRSTTKTKLKYITWIINLVDMNNTKFENIYSSAYHRPWTQKQIVHDIKVNLNHKHKYKFKLYNNE